MRLPPTLLIAALTSLVQATTDPARAYILGDTRPTASHQPTLSPEEARLIIAHRLGASAYHSLGHADETTLAHLNTFGAPKRSFLSHPGDEELVTTLVLLMDGASDEVVHACEKELQLSRPDFTIIDAPSAKANARLVRDIHRQCEAVGHGQDRDIVSWDLTKDHHDLASRLRYFASTYHTILLILFPESAYQSPQAASPYGTYSLPPPPSTSLHPRGADRAEEPAHALFSRAAPPPRKLPKVIPTCHASAEACVASTNNCSGHGACFPRSAGGAASPCFACACAPTLALRNGTNVTTHWGGGACSKLDISAPFWLVAAFSVLWAVVLAGAVGMLFAVGEERLPGVIGAGVAGPKGR